MTRKQIILEFL